MIAYWMGSWPVDGPGAGLSPVVVGLGVAGLVLLGLGLFLLWRRRGAPLSEASAWGAPEPLSEGGALSEERYRVLRSINGDAEGRNVYVVKTTAPVLICSNCKLRISADEARYCSHCGADLQNVTLVYPQFWVEETSSADTFSLTRRVLALSLSHANLVLPVDVFEDREADPPRFYRVLEKVVSDSEPMARPALRHLLTWGIGLARGMAYLHAQDIVLQDVDLDHVIVQGDRARWLCIDNVDIVDGVDSVDVPEAAKVDDVRRLASLLRAALSESETTSESETPSEPETTSEPEIPLELEEAAESAARVIALLERVQQDTEVTAAAFAETLSRALYAFHAPEESALAVAARTDVGQVRAVNEDSIFVLDASDAYVAQGVPVGVFVVADGMGGHAAGDVASQLTVETVATRAQTLPARAEQGDGLPDARAWLEETVDVANLAVYDARRAAANDMGCTLVMALFVGNFATIVNIGDSRAYRLSEQGIEQITNDHSLVARLVAFGEITEQEARHHPRKNVIYRVLGDKPTSEFDLFEEVFVPGEALLLCSDGLSGMLLDEEIWEIWRAASSPDSACDHWVTAANRAGGVDNISVVLVNVVRRDGVET